VLLVNSRSDRDELVTLSRDDEQRMTTQLLRYRREQPDRGGAGPLQIVE
jgi:hypothetical protein